MSEDERRDWLGMKQTLAGYLPIPERQIIEFAADGDNKEYDFLIKKAVEYRNVLAGMNELLKQEGL